MASLILAQIAIRAALLSTNDSQPMPRSPLHSLYADYSLYLAIAAKSFEHFGHYGHHDQLHSDTYQAEASMP